MIQLLYSGLVLICTALASDLSRANISFVTRMYTHFLVLFLRQMVHGKLTVVRHFPDDHSSFF